MEATKLPTRFNRPKCLKLVSFPQGNYDTWSKKQRTLMEAHAATWATEYVKDFDAYATAIRLGFEEDELKPAIKRYMKHWLVAAYIQQLQEEFLQLNVATKDRLVQVTYRDAVDFSPRSDPRSRTAAQKTLTTLLGLDIKEKHITHGLAADGSMRGGVMILPAPLSFEAWEEKASESQRALKEEVRK